MSDRDEILVLTTGGTFDKIYFDAMSSFEVGQPVVSDLLEQAVVKKAYRVVEILRKDSLELTDTDRQTIRAAVLAAPNDLVVITHGTDTMTDTGRVLADIPQKTIVLTGALSPARFAETDAMFNLGMAFATVQTSTPGVYITMNGTVFDATRVHKDRSRNAFIAD
ncbi:asparaginase [Pseudomonadales bacterium]|nr:asparaginase [Pseudomonadales bacterium]MDB4151132.1 asparaginase [Pseudomonadales bacterium]MDB9879273.1 asparaginase [Pseudomonadales bacterium]